MPDEIVQQTAVYGIEPLEFSAFQLDFPSISPFLGDTWWLETMDFAGTPTPAPGSSGLQVGTPAPGSSGTGVGNSGNWGKPTTPNTDAVLIDPGTFGTSGGEVGKVVESDKKFEQYFSENPLIVIWDNPTRYIHLHLLSLQEYRENAEFLKAVREFEARPNRATKWFTDWLFSRPNILEGLFSSPAIYVGANVANMIPDALTKQQVILDADAGECPPNPQSYNYGCDYSGFRWHNDELKRLKEQTRWIWQQWQPDWDYFAIDIMNMLVPGGHWPYNLPNFTTFDSRGGFPPASFDIYEPRAWSDSDFSPNLQPGYAPATLKDKQLNLPVGGSGLSPVYFRNYTPMEIPVYVAPDVENPVMTMPVFVWNKSNIRNLVLG